MKSLAVSLALAAVGVAAMLFGSNDDSPGLVVIGVVLIVGGATIGGRAIYRITRG